MNFEGEFGPQNPTDTAKIVITDSTNDISIKYNLDGNSASSKDTFIVPVGANYRVVVTTTSTFNNPYEVEFISTDCQQEGNTCIGTMGTTLQSIQLEIEPPQQP